MPITKSAKKRLRQNIAQRARNRAAKSAVKTQLRKVREAIDAGDAAKSEAELRLAAKKLDKAAAKKIVHPNAVARTKSRLSARVKAIKAPKV
ncbi:MAG: 30S ribosomal protein S20 [Pirellulales bacterium]